MKRPPSYPHLRRLFAAYVNQDWDVDGPTPDGAVRRFAREAKAADRAGAVADAERLLARAPTDNALDRALDRLGCGYRPAGAGTTAGAWLRRVVGLLREAP